MEGSGDGGSQRKGRWGDRALCPREPPPAFPEPGAAPSLLRESPLLPLCQSGSLAVGFLDHVPFHRTDLPSRRASISFVPVTSGLPPISSLPPSSPCSPMWTASLGPPVALGQWSSRQERERKSRMRPRCLSLWLLPCRAARAGCLPGWKVARPVRVPSTELWVLETASSPAPPTLTLLLLAPALQYLFRSPCTLPAPDK